MTTHAIATRLLDELAATPIRDLVERWPAAMGVLAPLGIDLCCGGAHPLGEALDLRGIARKPVLAEVAAVVRDER